MKNIHSEDDSMRLDRLEKLLGKPKLPNTKIFDCSECVLVFQTDKQFREHIEKQHSSGKIVKEPDFLELASIEHDALVDSEEEKRRNYDIKVEGETKEDASYEIVHQPEAFSEEKKINIKLFDDSEDFEEALKKLDGPDKERFSV